MAQTVARERLELLVEKSMRLAEAGITWSTIEATQRKINAQAVQTGADPTDFTGVLELIYAEVFGPEETQ